MDKRSETFRGRFKRPISVRLHLVGYAGIARLDGGRRGLRPSLGGFARGGHLCVHCIESLFLSLALIFGALDCEHRIRGGFRDIKGG